MDEKEAQGSNPQCLQKNPHAFRKVRLINLLGPTSPNAWLDGHRAFAAKDLAITV